MASENARALLNTIANATPYKDDIVFTSVVRTALGWSQQKYAAVVKRAIDAGLVEVSEADSTKFIRATEKGNRARVGAHAAEAQALGSEAGRTSAIVAALESLWAAFRREHTDLPDAQIILASGHDRKGPARNGHWHAGQWEGDTQHEVLIAGERLADGAIWVAETLLHEACHGIAHGNGMKDTSRQGRWHNANFAAICETVGLCWEKDKRVGVRTTGLTQEAQDRYAGEIMVLEAAMSGTARKRPEAKDVPDAPKPRVQWRKALERVWEEAEAEGGEFAYTIGKLLGEFEGVLEALNS